MSDAAKNTRKRVAFLSDQGSESRADDLRAVALDLEALGARLSALEAKTPAPSGDLVERMAEAIGTASEARSVGPWDLARAALAVAAGELCREPTEDEKRQFHQDYFADKGDEEQGRIAALSAFLSRRRAEAGLPLDG